MDYGLMIFLGIMMAHTLGILVILLFVMLINSRVATIYYRTEALEYKPAKQKTKQSDHYIP